MLHASPIPLPLLFDDPSPDRIPIHNPAPSRAAVIRASLLVQAAQAARHAGRLDDAVMLTSLATAALNEERAR